MQTDRHDSPTDRYSVVCTYGRQHLPWQRRVADWQGDVPEGRTQVGRWKVAEIRDERTRINGNE